MELLFNFNFTLLSLEWAMPLNKKVAENWQQLANSGLVNFDNQFEIIISDQDWRCSNAAHSKKATISILQL